MAEWMIIDQQRPPSGEVIIALPSGWVTAADYAAGCWWRNGKALSGRPTHFQRMPEHPTMPDRS